MPDGLKPAAGYLERVPTPESLPHTLLKRQTPFKAMTSMMPGGLCYFDNPAPRQVNCRRVEWNFLKTGGIAPTLGRDFTPEEDRFTVWDGRSPRAR